jgi:4-hydroxy 2-oxovalerate aldolase
MKKITISDHTLRDGNHAAKHKISLTQIKKYCEFAESANIPIVEIGHGNGLGASSLLIGESAHTDEEMISSAREILKKTKLCVHTIPGISTIKNNIQPAIDLGVDIFRVASHCTEATITKTHIEYLKNKNKTVYGVLMMTALVDESTLLNEATKMSLYGADAIIIMDSTGTYLPFEVTNRVKLLKDNLPIQIGFHGHNNLSMAVINSVMALNSGATIIDACIRGFGAGAGNTQLEIIVPVLTKYGYETNINFSKLITEADLVMSYLIDSAPSCSPINVLTGLNKIFSGFEKPIIKASKLHGIEYSSLIFELGNRKLVAGQEDLILQIADILKKTTVNI